MRVPQPGADRGDLDFADWALDPAIGFDCTGASSWQCSLRWPDCPHLAHVGTPCLHPDFCWGLSYLVTTGGPSEMLTIFLLPRGPREAPRRDALGAGGCWLALLLTLRLDALAEGGGALALPLAGDTSPSVE